MPDYGNYNAGGSTFGTLLPAGDHPCKLSKWSLTRSKGYQTDEETEQYRFTFEALRWKDPEGEPGVITAYTGINYGNDKAKLTLLLGEIFGRTLTDNEYRCLNYDKMVDTVKGFVMVLPHRKKDGTPTVKYGAFRLPDSMGGRYYEVSDFLDFAPVRLAPPPPRTEQYDDRDVPARSNSSYDDDIADPFAEDN